MALDQFGGPEQLRLREVAVPELDRGDVLIRVQAAGVGEWDPFEREGGFAEMLGLEPKFPYVLGSEGAGVIAAVGSDVRQVQVGDHVYALGFPNPKGGFYAEYAVVSAGMVAPIPPAFSVEQAAAMGGVGITARRGLEALGIKRGDSLLIFGASGGIGHVAVQLAKQRGARVLAAASGEDGVALAARLGADATINGRTDDVLAAARAFAPDGLSAALITAGGDALDRALAALRDGGHAAFPQGVEPEPKVREGIRLTSYNGDPEPQILASFQRSILENPIIVHVAKSFRWEQAAAAHRALAEHYLGKLVLRIE